MAVARASRNWSWRPLVAVAAAVVVVGLAVPAIRSIDLGDDAGDSAATSAAAADEPAADSAEPADFAAQGEDEAADDVLEAQPAADTATAAVEADMADEPAAEPAEEQAAPAQDEFCKRNCGKLCRAQGLNLASSSFNRSCRCSCF